MKCSRITLCLMALLLVSALAATAQVPNSGSSSAPNPHYTTWDGINFDFQMSGSDGLPVADGSYQCVFSLHTDPTVSSVVWTETQAVNIVRGRGTVVFGDVTPIPLSTLGFPDGNLSRVLYLEVQVESEILSPRTRLRAVPYANIAERVMGDVETEPQLLRLRSDDGSVPFELTHTGSGGSMYMIDSFFDITYRIEWSTSDGNANLTVANIGSSGEDGVSLNSSPGTATIDLGIEEDDLGVRIFASGDGSGAGMIVIDTGLNDSGLIDLRVDDSGGHLVISNIGSSGEDGVSIDVDPDSARSIVRASDDFGQSKLIDKATPSLAQAVCKNETLPSGEIRMINTRADATGAYLRVVNIGSSGEDGVSLEASDTASTCGIEHEDIGAKMKAKGGTGGQIALTQVPSGETIPIEIVSMDLSGDGNGSLIVSNLGSSGLDGVRLSSSETGSRISLSELPSGESIPIEILSMDLSGSRGQLHVSNLGSSGLDGVSIQGPGGGSGGSVRLSQTPSGETIPIEIVSMDLSSSGEGSLTVSNIGSSGLDGVSIQGGGGSGGRIVLRELPSGESIPIELVALSLKSIEPVMVCRPIGSGAADPWLYQLDVEDNAPPQITMRTPRSVSGVGDSLTLRSSGLELRDGTTTYTYDNLGLRYRSSSVTRASLTGSGELYLFGGARMAESSGTRVVIGPGPDFSTLTVNGDICATGFIGPCSDARFKRDVETIGNPVEKLLKLRGVGFNWRTDEFPDRSFTDRPQVGFIAQEVQEVLPEVVMEGSDGYLAVDYARFTPLLVEAVKDQQSTITELKAEVAELSDLVRTLLAANDAQATEKKVELAKADR